jgi:hypothetical protein
VQRGAVAGGEQSAADRTSAQRLAGRVGQGDVEDDAQAGGRAPHADDQRRSPAVRCTSR